MQLIATQNQIADRVRPVAHRTGSDAGPRIAVVDDDASVRRLLRTAFEASGFAVTEASSEAELMAALRAHDIALITLDLSLRHDDGLAVVQAVRRISQVPVVIVTARGTEIDRIVGLEIGADDYIVKPFNVREVVARIRAVLRRTKPAAALIATADRDVVLVGHLSVDLAAHEVTTTAGNVIRLTSAEFRLLAAFVRHPGRVLSRDFLIDAVGGIDAVPLERCIDTTVSRLRRKIAEPQLIKTVRGAGYIFTGKIQT